MKTYLLILLAAIAVHSSAQAKLLKGRSTFSIGYGYGTQDQILDGMFDLHKDLNYLGDRNNIDEGIANRVFGANGFNILEDDAQRTGAIFLTYRFKVIKWISLGVTGGFEQQRRGLTISDAIAKQQVTIGNLTRNVYTIAAEVRVQYLGLPFVKLYGQLGLGNSFTRENFSNAFTNAEETVRDNTMAIQLTPFGISAGKKLHAFAEVGYGYKGIAHVGIGYSF